MNQGFKKNPGQKELPKRLGLIITIGVIGIIIRLISIPVKIGIPIYKDTPTRGRVIFVLIILIAVVSFIIKIRKFYRLDKAIEKGIAIRKTVKIIDFKFANKRGGEDETTNGYYVVMSDGENNYKGRFHRGAKIYGKSEEELMNDNFYIKEGITLDLNNRDTTRQQLDQKISELRSEKNGLNLLKTFKLLAWIKKIENKKHDLEPYHLHTGEGNFYIGDEFVILIDPDDSNNYTPENGNV